MKCDTCVAIIPLSSADSKAKEERLNKDMSRFIAKMKAMSIVEEEDKLKELKVRATNDETELKSWWSKGRYKVIWCQKSSRRVSMQVTLLNIAKRLNSFCFYCFKYF
mmetsp:Transcript_27993/g.32282  ORF Transcript_27993/g.32282 Transcript_27993/m.32282 type:complete len:107 (-) Transcript_27993:286-606(-)